MLRGNRGGLRAKAMRMSAEAPYKVVLLRHGESTWNDEGLFTGWADCPLSEAGQQEAHEAAKLLADAGFTFDLAYTSVLKRAIRTLWTVMEDMDLMWIPVIRDWRLNERHYGGLQGLNKKETVAKHGTDQVQIWRRSYDIPPPEVDEDSEHYPANDPKYAGIPKDMLPKTESLKLTGERFMPCWNDEIVPAIKSGKRIVIAAHGNTLRALVKYLDDIPEDQITGLNIPTAVPLVYTLDKDMKPIKAANAMAPLSGEYLGDQDEVRARIEGVANQTAAPTK